MKRIILAALLSSLSGMAFACPSPLTGKDAAGTTQNFGVTLDGSLNCYGNIAIVDGANAANKATVTAGNALKVDGSAVTQPVSGTITANAGSGTFTVGGTVTANQGSPPWTVTNQQSNIQLDYDTGAGTQNLTIWGIALPASGGAVAGGTATNPVRIDPTGTTTQPVSGTVTANAGSGTFTVGGTVTANQGTTPWVDNITQWNSVALGSPSNYGTSPGAVAVPGVNAFVTNTVTVSGTVTANQGGAPWSDNITQIAGNSVSTAATGTLKVGVVGNAGGAMDAAGQNATSPANELLTACQFNTSPTTVTSGNITPVQCNNAGALNVAIVSGGGSGGTASSFGAAFPATGTAIGVKNGANMVNLTADGSNNLNVDCVTGCAGASDHTATGTVTAVNNNVAVSTVGTGNVTALVSADTNVTLIFEGTVEGSTWFTVNAYPVGGGASVTTVTTTGQWAIPAGGFNQIRMRVTAVGATPTATVFLNAGAGSTQPNVVVNPTAANLNATVTQGTSPWVVSGSGTFTVSGTVTANQGTSPWVENVSQFGGNNVVTGTGASGVGIPRVTVSNDSNILATQSGTWTVQQGTPPWSVVGNVASGASDSGNPVKVGGVFNTTQPTVTTGQRVDAQSTARGALIVATGVDTFSVSGTVTANAGTGNFNENLAQVNGSTVSTAATGVQKVGITGNTGAAMDAGGQNAASPANELLTACQFNTSPTGLTSGNVTPLQCSTAARLIVDGSQVTQPVSGTVTANQGGTWTVQPGNTANTTPWLFSISQGGNTAAVNASSQLSVNCANCSGSGVSQQDLTGFTFGTTNMVPVGGVFSTTPSVVPTGQAGVAQITANRAVQQNLRDSSSQELGAALPGKGVTPVQINQVVAFSAPKQTIVPSPVDFQGLPRDAATLFDGQHYADIIGGSQIPNTTNGALVVVPSPKVSLQCPFVVGLNQTTSTQVVTNPGNKSLHICLFTPLSATAQNVSLVEGTGSTCGTGTIGLWGGTSASVAVAANGGAALVSDRIIIPMQKLGDNLCVLQSAAGNVSGTLTYGVF